MSYRQRISKSASKKIFAHSADKIKKINISPKVQRGGIRL